MALPFSTPALDPYISLGVAGFIATSYVGSLYLFKSTRLVFAAPDPNASQGEQERQRQEGEQWRNDPKVIRARLTAVTLSTLLSCAIVGGLVWNACKRDNELAFRTTLQLLGFGADAQTVLPHLLTPLLFTGPLYVALLEQSLLPFQHKWLGLRLFTNWHGFRNYIAGPVTEELNFRACVTAVVLLGGWRGGALVFIAPLSFGIAHLHHWWDIYNRYGRNSDAVRRATITTLVQFAYTTLFGIFCTFLLLRTGSVLAPLTSHVFCNIMGLPSPGWAAQKHPNLKALIWLAHVAGIVGFGLLLWPWSEPTTGGRYYWNFS
ncbi:hypothetical protein BKA62DRAFT_643212 [Auriculariales sp. MPI-PUGE-AT-0066]|nr:hypothetical protein BKA62DRAFT_643212 [Auriculariales sp. MPI-PUGE-AT-0066]